MYCLLNLRLHRRVELLVLASSSLKFRVLCVLPQIRPQIREDRDLTHINVDGGERLLDGGEYMDGGGKLVDGGKACIMRRRDNYAKNSKL